MSISPNPHIEEFIAIVTDGAPISDLDPPCPTCHHSSIGETGKARKRRYLQLSREILEILQVSLGAFGTASEETGRQYITTDEGGQLIAGSVSLDLGWVRIGFHHHKGERYASGDFQFNYRDNPKRWEIGGWAKWEELRDMQALALRIKEGRPKAIVPGALDGAQVED